ncbi:MAG TPA: hypothetical protein ENJ82_16460 [Bacteroidetes bacterium]|nr:hypothetical protein [Bacteroidota bacterium]
MLLCSYTLRKARGQACAKSIGLVQQGLPEDAAMQLRQWLVCQDGALRTMKVPDLPGSGPNNCSTLYATGSHIPK